MNFADIMSDLFSLKYTENGATAFNKLDSSLLTLFGQIGSLRSRDPQEIEEKFYYAFNEDPLLAVKLLFYAGNIRGGLGERRTFQILIKWLGNNFPSIMRKNLEYIPYFNRWDSVFALVGTPVENDMWELIEYQLNNDRIAAAKFQPISLLAKWMPSINTSSKKTRALARKAINKLYFIDNEKEYRKFLSNLREYLNVTEHRMSAQEWLKINYEKVPSYAMSRYSRAFQKHDAEGFTKYREALSQGKAKVNASTLYPYNLIEDVWTKWDSNLVADEQWKALPNYISGDNNIVIMADVSSSMTGRPMYTSVGLAIYFAERNQGFYKNKYMTFSSRPRFIEIFSYNPLYKKVKQVMKTGVGYSTDLEAAFQTILRTSADNNLSNEEMPKALIVISDMEIDQFNPSNSDINWNFIDEMKHRFQVWGYKLPKLIMWNVEARNDTFLSKSDDVIYVSGQSAAVFKTVLNSITGNSYEVMLKTLNDPMYDVIAI